MRRALLVLAAGRGQRMGGPKALLMIEQRPLALLHAERFVFAADPNSVVVLVVRREVAQALSTGSDAPSSGAHVRLVVSDEADELGPAGSLRAAARSPHLADVEAVLIQQVDRLPPTPDEQAPLVDALLTHDAARWAAHGHPVGLRGDVLRARYGAGAPLLRDLLRELGARCARLPGAGARTPHLNTPDDVVRLTGAPPRFFGAAT